jgi:hypothetical protein
MSRQSIRKEKLSTAEINLPEVENLILSKDTLTMDLYEGRILSVTLAWFPRLWHTRQTERSNWRLICKGQGVHLLLE